MEATLECSCEQRCASIHKEHWLKCVPVCVNPMTKRDEEDTWLAKAF